VDLGYRPWALDFAPDNYGAQAFPRQILDPIANKLEWQPQDWEPALRFWTLLWDPNLGAWLQDQDPSQASIFAAREFAAEHSKWRFTQAELLAKGWLDPSHLAWQTSFVTITSEIEELFDLMEDDRDRFLAEANVQADGLAGYFISLIWADAERRPWTFELIRCGLAIGNLVYMNYKARFLRVRPSTIAPGLVPPFGPPRHPSFPSGHSFLGHFIALLLLEIDELAAAYGEPAPVPGDPGTKPTLADVMSADPFNGPLLWLGYRLARNRERIGVHYRSDTAASRYIAGAIWALLMTPADSAGDATPPGAPQVNAANLIECPTLQRVLRMAQAEWVRA